MAAILIILPGFSVEVDSSSSRLKNPKGGAGMTPPFG